MIKIDLVIIKIFDNDFQLDIEVKNIVNNCDINLNILVANKRKQEVGVYTLQIYSVAQFEDILTPEEVNKILDDMSEKLSLSIYSVD